MLRHVAGVIQTVSVRAPHPGRHRRTARVRQDHARGRGRRPPDRARPPRRPSGDRRLPPPAERALPARRVLGRGVLLLIPTTPRLLNRVLLDPLGPGGDRRHRRVKASTASTDTAWTPPMTTAPPDSVLLFDGVVLDAAGSSSGDGTCASSCRRSSRTPSVVPSTETDRRHRRPMSSGVGASGTSRRSGCTSPRTAPSPTPTSSCATTTCRTRRGEPERTEQDLKDKSAELLRIDDRDDRDQEQAGVCPHRRPRWRTTPDPARGPRAG